MKRGAGNRKLLPSTTSDGEDVSTCTPKLTVRFVFLLLPLLMRLVIVAIMVYHGAYDLTRYTYISYTVVTIIYALLVCTQFSVFLHRIVILYAAPYVIQNAILVSLCVVMIVINNPAMMTMHIDKYGGESSIGLVYAVDFVIHHMPPLEAFVVLVVIFAYYSAILRHYVDYCLTYKIQKALYVLYFMFVDFAIMLLYTLVFDFQTYYPNSYGRWVIYGMVGTACLLVAGSTFLILYYLAPQDIKVAISAHRNSDTASQNKRPIKPSISEQFSSTPIAKMRRGHHVILRTLFSRELYTLD